MEQAAMSRELRVLVLEDEPADAEFAERELRKAGMVFSSRRVETRADFVAALADFNPNIILADYKLPGFDGMAALAIAREKLPAVPFIFVSGTMGEEFAIETLHQGAADYVLKGHLSKLVPAVNRALLDAEERRRRKDVEEALKESEERLRKMAESARDAIVVVEAEHGTITAWNLAAEAVFGHTRTEALGQPLHELLTPPRFREKAQRGLSHFANSGEGAAIGKTLELLALHKNGTEFPIELSLSAMQIHGKWHATGIVRDITKRKRAEEALRQREAELNESQRLAQIGSWDWNALNDTIWWSDEYYQIYGFDPKQPPPNYVEHQKAYTRESAERLDVLVKRAMETGEPYEVELDLAQPTPTTRWIVARGEAKRDASGKIRGLRGTAQNITERKQTEEALRQSDAKYRRIVDTAREGIWEFGPDTMTTYVNARMAAMLGYSSEEMKGRPMTDFMFEEDAPDYLREMENRRQGLPGNYERRFRRKNGETVWTLVSATPVLDDDHRFKGSFGMFSDITERKRVETEFFEVSRYNEMILESAGEGIFGVDIDGLISFINPAALVILGYGKDELVGLDSHVALHHSKPDGSPYALEDCPMHQSLLSGLGARGKEEILWCKNGSPLPVLFSSTPIRENDKIIGAVVTFQDITELKRYQGQLERQSNYDDLTDLPNRNLLADRLTQAVARCQREQKKLAVLVLNLDRFREINDSLGRTVGDSILRETADRLRQLGQKMDTLARSGGDEFVLVGEVEKEEEAAILARRILETLSQPFHIEGRELSLYAGVGISVLPKDGGNSEILLNNALVAMYRTKASGGNNFLFYSAEMNADTLKRLSLENDLRRAVERDELLLYYQPQLSLRNGEIIGMEALVRWRHPLRGLVSPMEFIPLAESTGLIVPIGEWVLRTACTQNRAWQAAGLHTVAVAVNLSARQFETQDIVALTAQVLRETGLDPSYLELELTESAAMSNAEAFIVMTEGLKSLSVTLSIDDFGTGYSSLSYLKRFAIDRLKIDQSFVRDIVQDPDSTAIVVAVIALAHGLGLSVIAEGVETEAQLNFLRTRGCDEMQGYYFSKPLPAAEFEQLLREQRKLTFTTATELPGRTLLLVDDEPHILSALKRLLRREGYRILTATSAQDGLELLATHEVAVVMSDQRMPNMTGSEFLAKVRKMYPDTIRIILSGYTDLKSITEVVNRGEIYKFLEKPWNEAAMRETLREAFRNYEALRAGRGNAI